MLVGKLMGEVLSIEHSWSVATGKNICDSEVYTNGVVEPLIIPKPHRLLDVIHIWWTTTQRT